MMYSVSLKPLSKKRVWFGSKWVSKFNYKKNLLMVLFVHMESKFVKCIFFLLSSR